MVHHSDGRGRKSGRHNRRDYDDREEQVKGEAETIVRHRMSLESALEKQPGLLEVYYDAATTEIYRNADGTVFVDRLNAPKEEFCHMPNGVAIDIINMVAGASGMVINKNSPMMDTEFILDGSRFEANVPPIVSSPTFNIRKKAILVFSLDDYVRDGIMTEAQKDKIKRAVTNHLNILVIGGTGSGKTTLTNAILREMSEQFPSERILILEDTTELQCVSRDHVQLHTAPLATKPVTMTLLVKATLRMAPRRIVVGEIRGGEGLDLLDVWNTGHPGGVCTIHANTSLSGLTRFKSLIMRHEDSPEHGVEALIGEAVHMIVNIQRKGEGGREVKDVLEICGYDEVERRYIVKDDEFEKSVEAQIAYARELIMRYENGEVLTMDEYRRLKAFAS